MKPLRISGAMKVGAASPIEEVSVGAAGRETVDR